MQTVRLGDTIIDQFPVYESDGYTKKSGETVFTKTAWKDGVVQGTAITVTEIGSTGEYKVSFTPDASGFWKCEVFSDYSKERWYLEADVSQVGVTFGSVISDDGSTVTLGAWMDIDGQRATDLDSMAAVVRDNAGNLVIDLGTDTTDSVDGVFSFSTAIGNLSYDTPLILALTATRSGLTWYGNEAFVVYQ